ncbi:hypothetical protein D3C76_435960 [compost metagenome]
MSEAKHDFVSHLQAAITLFIAAFLREQDRQCQRSPAYPILSTGGRSGAVTRVDDDPIDLDGAFGDHDVGFTSFGNHVVRLLALGQRSCK